MSRFLGPIASALGLLAGPILAQACLENCFAIVGVDVISMGHEAAVTEDQTVLIAGTRITAIGPVDEVTIPFGHETIDGHDKWLIPGLADMHVHFMSYPLGSMIFPPEVLLSPYLAYGVTQIADLAASPQTNEMRDAVAAGTLIAPFIASGAMVDGSPPIREGTTVIATPEEAEAVVRQIAADNYDFVKVYSALDLPTFHAILDAAKDVGIRVIGHIPGGRETRPEEAIVPGFAMVAHVEELSQRATEKTEAEAARIAGLLAENGTAVTSTLLIGRQILAQTEDPDARASFEGLRMLHPLELAMWFEMNGYVNRRDDARIARLAATAGFNATLVAAMRDAGATFLAGTDAAFVAGAAPGLALHQELEMLVEAGLSPREALAAATVTPAEWLGVLDDRGTVEVGKRANLVLLDGDPLKDIANTQRIRAVLLNGHLLDRARLDEMLAEQDALYAPYRPILSPQGTAAIAAH